MKNYLNFAIRVAGLLAAFVLAGCSTTPQVAILAPVGPDSPAPTGSERQGILQVYSARVPANTDVNFETFFANDDFGGNRFPNEPAHTDYTIYTPDGQVFERVRNARNLDDPKPALVTLPEGKYNIVVRAKDANPGTVRVLVPVTIQAGRTTHVDLERD